MNRESKKELRSCITIFSSLCFIYFMLVMVFKAGELFYFATFHQAKITWHSEYILGILVGISCTAWIFILLGEESK